MKIRTLNQLQDSLDREVGWRTKEIIDLKSAVRTSKSLAQSTLIRAGLALLYAHWEGFIKISSSSYIAYLNGQKLVFSDLKTPLVVIGIKAHLARLKESGTTSTNAETLDFIREKLSDRFSVTLSGAINTESNLSSKVFSNIAASLCLNLTPYESKFKFIDESLVSRRNQIAHGEYLDVSAEDWRALADEVLALIRMYKADIEIAASNSSFRLAA